ncbi:RNA polymerase, sigma 28 subunit, SigD/FliA/WhiG [Desulfobulbus propionicus DSM 2032]|jgi:RNA polymerase sigma factor for flagellar operon FliA|uniref:RNA polymerase, sigma 28 subunit, SigD/FliA/WhiG n=1 Tax=Desulfobulbus propionicus (strain ATCC 33891 / DSM 2032 / VKM B-1956 / 1pr3) TaxID=577650 RepID=A0A7U4DPW3_DESPD|nr:FliA/WhiG family RNA polymerase sigma factor [Desulfobulbus propionicus]ADW18387.1 RNA polymerase, sigma 28 subunit, SigD/FliA/WhiG [Desulfobulbus propionicus DSM 2032]
MFPPVPPLDDRSQLIRENMPLVELVVQRMTPQVPSFMTKEDMISAAMVGLVDAANKFDPTKGVKFKTFAEYRVRGAIFDEMRKLDWFSRSMRDKQNTLTQTMLRLERQLGRSPEEEEMAREMALSIDEYRDLLAEVSHLGCVSLHETLDHTEDGRSFLDSLEDIGGPVPDDLLEKEEMTRVMAEILEELSEKERLVIALYYYEELTQKEIAEVLSVSEGRVSQLHSQALLKLRVKLLNSELYEP